MEGEEKIYSMFIASCLNKKVHSFVPKEEDADEVEEDADEVEEEEEPAPPDAHLRKSSRVRCRRRRRPDFVGVP